MTSVAWDKDELVRFELRLAGQLTALQLRPFRLLFPQYSLAPPHEVLRLPPGTRLQTGVLKVVRERLEQALKAGLPVEVAGPLD
jgi:hypothetical protein